MRPLNAYASNCTLITSVLLIETIGYTFVDKERDESISQ